MLIANNKQICFQIFSLLFLKTNRSSNVVLIYYNSTENLEHKGTYSDGNYNMLYFTVPEVKCSDQLTNQSTN